MKKLKLIVYDAETKCPVHNAREKKIPGITYAPTWDSYEAMGIATICAYDAWERRVHVFTYGNFDDFQQLVNERDEIVSYNGLGFDDKLCKAHGIKVKTTYDIMKMLKDKLGEPEKYDRFKSVRGFSLNQICEDNELPLKKMKGSMAPVQWQLQKYGDVINYCIGDVMATFKLFERRREIYVSSYDKIVCLREPAILMKDYEDEQRRVREEAARDRQLIADEDAAEKARRLGRKEHKW